MANNESLYEKENVDLSKQMREIISSSINDYKKWNFDIISLERLNNHEQMISLGFTIMNDFKVCQTLNIDANVLTKWLKMIQAYYRSKVHYHNATHAFDVLQAVAYFMATEKLDQILDDQDKAAILIAAMMHDVNHPGRNNSFICNSFHRLAMIYNDQSVLENHHCSLAFRLTSQSDRVNIFKNVGIREFKMLRANVIDMVLATDMSKHNVHVDNFLRKLKEWKSKSTKISEIAESKALIRRILIKCADISNPCRPLNLSKEWANRIYKEQIEQNEDEKLLNLPISMPMFDRDTCNVPITQLSFIDGVATEMFNAWHEFANEPDVINNLNANITYWKDSNSY